MINYKCLKGDPQGIMIGLKAFGLVFSEKNISAGKAAV